MAESVNKAEKAQKKSWFKGLKSEFNKITWTDPQTIGKQTAAVVSITCVMGVFIIVIDRIVLELMNLLIK